MDKNITARKIMYGVEQALISKGRLIRSIEIKQLEKNNSSRTGLIIREADRTLAPIIYIDEALDQIENFNVPFSVIVDNICDIYLSTTSVNNINPADYFQKDYMKTHTVLSIVHMSNELFLKDKIYRTVCDLAVVPRIIASNLAIKDAVASLAVPKSALSDFNISENELFSYADNTYEIINIQDILKTILPEEIFNELAEPQIPMYVVTNESRVNGASVLAFPEKLAKLLESVSLEDVIILPSSIHEIIVIPVVDDYTSEELRDMVEEINENSVDPEERLSNSIYSFNSKEKILRIIES